LSGADKNRRRNQISQKLKAIWKLLFFLFFLCCHFGFPPLKNLLFAKKIIAQVLCAPDI